MQVWLEFSDNGKDARLELDAVPRTGDHVLWLATAATDGFEYDTETGYRVDSVEWVLGGEGKPHVTLCLVPDKEQVPLAGSIRASDARG